ncbi:proton-transporting V-type ATPase complex assembly regulator TMEM9 isoform X2 [Chironomus tepperi]|uniref:proton-transporting V-type ATPase complex assembly regulator TMEM9 isoform X2 n=1 Tax=Chironomus tepperi TaxID=113505 RepID=UPI00391FAABF
MKKFLIICCITLIQIPYIINAQSYEDKRCKCICPSINAVLNNTDSTERILVIANVGQARCDCDSVILPKYADKIKGKEQEFCPRCECKHENRNTTVIKVVVIIVIWIISLLSIYMLFLNLLEPLLNKRSKQNYQEHLDEPGYAKTPSAVHMSRRIHSYLKKWLLGPRKLPKMNSHDFQTKVESESLL